MTLFLQCKCEPVRCVRITTGCIEPGDVFLVCLMVNGDRLPFYFLVWLLLPLCFCRGKFSLLYTSISPFLIFHILPVFGLLFFNLPAKGLRGSYADLYACIL